MAQEGLRVKGVAQEGLTVKKSGPGGADSQKEPRRGQVIKEARDGWKHDLIWSREAQ